MWVVQRRASRTGIRRAPVILGAIALDLFAVILGGVFALLPVFARDILDAGPTGLGLLRAAPALGAVLISLVLVRLPLDRQSLDRPSPARLPQAKPHVTNPTTALLVCSGPSLRTTESELRDAFYDGGKIVAVNGASIDAEQDIVREGREITRLTLTLACVARSGRPARLPPAVAAALGRKADAISDSTKRQTRN